jgi:hypothetical protein
VLLKKIEKKISAKKPVQKKKTINLSAEEKNLNMSIEVSYSSTIAVQKEENNITLDETQQTKNEWLSSRHIERYLCILMKDNNNKINYFKTSIIDFNSFRPIILKSTAFIYNVGKHWVLISNFIPNHQYDSSVWFICDSMYKVRRSIYQKLFKKLLPQQDSVIIKFMNVQQQRGSDDCGLFSLAYFISLYNDEDPTDKLYIYKMKCDNILIYVMLTKI